MRREPELARRHIEHLVEVSRLLTTFEDVERTLPVVIETAGRTLPLRTVALVEEREGRLRVTTWQTDGVSPARLRAARRHALDAYAYLARTARPCPAESVAGDHAGTGRPAVGAAGGQPHSRYITLPLVAAPGQLLGALQVEPAGPADDADLAFVSALASRLAATLERHYAHEERARLLRRVQAAEAKYRRLLESAPDAIITMDQHGWILMANARAEELLGYHADELRGQGIELLLPAKGRRRAGRQRSLPALLRPSGTTVLQRKDGSRLLAEVSLSSVATESGQLITAIVRDVTERRRAEEERNRLLQREQEARAAAEASRRRLTFLAEASALHDASLDYGATLGSIAALAVADVADACVIEIIEESQRRRFVAGILPAEPEAEHAIAQLLEHVLSTGRPLAAPAIADPPRLVHEHDLAPLCAGLGFAAVLCVPLRARARTVGALALLSAERLYDAADLTMAEDVARRTALAIDNARLYRDTLEAVRCRDDLLAVVSHDLRNPLGVVMLNATMLLNSLPRDDRRRVGRKQLEAIRRSGERMNRLVQDLLDVGRIEARRFSVQRQEHTVETLVGDALEVLRPLAESRALRVEVEVPAGIAPVMVDRERIFQVLSNIVGNAIAFSAPGSAITIAAAPWDGGAARISVCDSGPGIPREHLPRVFDRFWRGSGAGRVGTGLGLYIAKGIIEAHGGIIWVDSEPGAGSTFHFTLPYAGARPRP